MKKPLLVMVSKVMTIMKNNNDNSDSKKKNSNDNVNDVNKIFSFRHRRKILDACVEGCYITLAKKAHPQATKQQFS